MFRAALLFASILYLELTLIEVIGDIKYYLYLQYLFLLCCFPFYSTHELRHARSSEQRKNADSTPFVEEAGALYASYSYQLNMVI
jgi:hypothetical protein